MVGKVFVMFISVWVGVCRGWLSSLFWPYTCVSYLHLVLQPDGEIVERYDTNVQMGKKHPLFLYVLFALSYLVVHTQPSVSAKVNVIHC